MKTKVLIDGKEQILQTKRVGLFKGLELWLGDEMLGHWPKFSELQTGKTYKTSSGAVIEIKYQSFPAALIMKLNGNDIEGSAGHATTQVEVAYAIFAFVTILNLVVGAIAYFGQVPTLLMAGYGIYNLITGTIFLALLASGWRNKKLWPLALGFTLFLIDAGMMINMMITLQMNNPGAVVMRIFLLIPWARGCATAFKLRNKKS